MSAQNSARAQLDRLVRRQDQLDDLERRQQSFIAIAAHELRAPAAVIHGIATTLEERADTLSPEQTEMLHHVLHAQTGRLVRLMDQLLDLSRLDGDAVRIQRSQFAIRERLERLIESVAGERAAEIELAVEPELEAVVDPDAFDRIVGNLVTNALRYGSAPVRVTAEQADRHFRLAVEDAGDGIPQELQPVLFERFTRAASGREAGDGAGLGLAIAQQYVSAHGGTIVYEQGEPRGARFRVVIPAPHVER